VDLVSSRDLNFVLRWCCEVSSHDWLHQTQGFFESIIASWLQPHLAVNLFCRLICLLTTWESYQPACIESEYLKSAISGNRTQDPTVNPSRGSLLPASRSCHPLENQTRPSIHHDRLVTVTALVSLGIVRPQIRKPQQCSVADKPRTYILIY